MKPAPFSYFAPGSLEEAVGLLSEHGEEAKVLAGGQSLVPMMAFRLATPSVLIDLNGVAELDHQRLEGDTLVLGALSRHRTVGDLALRLPLPNGGRVRSTFLEFARRHGDFAVAGVAALAELDDDGSMRDARLVLIGVADRPVRAHAAEAALRGRQPAEDVLDEAANAA